MNTNCNTQEVNMNQFLFKYKEPGILRLNERQK